MNYNNLLESLLHYAKTQPNKTAVYLLNNNDINVIDAQITYFELYQSAYNLAKILQKTSKIGDRALLCYPTGIDFIVAFYACLLAKVTAVAVVVPSNLGLIKKFVSIYEDCLPAFILTDNKTKEWCEKSTDFKNYSDVFVSKDSKETQIIATDDLKIEFSVSAESEPTPNVHQDDLAILQYTSGSTSNPKGVMISHGNLINNVMEIATAFNSKKEYIGLNWLPHTHDMGLIGSFLHSIHMGASLYLMSPLTIIRRPMLWLQALSKYQATITGGPCFVLKMCVDNLNADKVKDLDLSNLKYIIVGAEPIARDVITDFFKQLAPTGLSQDAFAPSYGLAESTLMVSTRLGLNAKTLDYASLNKNLLNFINDSTLSSTTVVSCGLPYQVVKIVAPSTQVLCEENEVGEIWIRGASVARGYWQNELENKANFSVKLPNDESTYFRTGDLGFLHQGELYIVGRIKDVIIINGLNYYPQDIEATVLACDDLLNRATCGAFSWRIKSSITDSFIILIRLNKHCSDEIKDYLTIRIKKQILKEFQLVPFDIQFVNFSLPKTTSGKLQRQACIPLYRESYVNAV